MSGIVIGGYVRRIGQDGVYSVIQLGDHVEGFRVARIVQQKPLTGAIVEVAADQLIPVENFCRSCGRYDDT